MGGINALSVGMKIDDNAMPHNRMGQGTNILIGDVKAPIEEGPHFTPQHEKLGRPQPGSPTDPLLNEIR